jgi:hypothetical protein
MDVVVDYSLPLDKMTGDQREAALAHGRESTQQEIAKEQRLHASTHQTHISVSGVLENQAQ